MTKGNNKKEIMKEITKKAGFQIDHPPCTKLFLSTKKVETKHVPIIISVDKKIWYIHEVMLQRKAREVKHI